MHSLLSFCCLMFCSAPDQLTPVGLNLRMTLVGSTRKSAGPLLVRGHLAAGTVVNHTAMPYTAKRCQMHICRCEGMPLAIVGLLVRWGAKPVLNRPQDPKLMAALAFEVKDRIDHMFEHPGPGNGTFLRDVSNNH